MSVQVPFNVFRLDMLKQISTVEVTRIINGMKCKNSPRDIIPTIILKRCVVVFAPAGSGSVSLKYSKEACPDIHRNQFRSMLQSLSECVEALTHWFLANNLQLNSNKTEAILFGTRQQIKKHSELSTFCIDDDDVKIGESIKILVVQLDATISMDKQSTAIVKACNYHVRALKHVRKCLTL